MMAYPTLLLDRIDTDIRLVPQRIADQPADQVAISHEGGTLTYGQLRERATRIALALRAAGAGPDTVVAVCLPASPELVLAEYAVLLAGAAFLPMDPLHPDDRLRFLLADSKALAVLADDRTVDRLGGVDVPVLDVTVLAGQSGVDADLPAPHPGDLAYVIYTSGSTGRPKGVAISHASLAGVADCWAAVLDLHPGDRTIQIAAVGFDATIIEIWPTLSVGATLCLVDPAARSTVELTLDFLHRQRITAAFLPTPLAEAMLTLPMPAGLALRRIGVGGDRLRLNLAPEHPFTMVNCYGPTEATVLVTVAQLGVGAAGLPPIGLPVNGARIELLDQYGRRVPDGETGELHLTGPCLARGYLHRPDLTADRFRPSPYPAVPGERLYATGDLGYRDAGSQLHFIGRVDDQVKIRGQRIELGEIEAWLQTHPAVRIGAVAVKQTAAPDPVLVGYVVPTVAPSTDGPALIEELRAHLAIRLTPAMVPAAWVFLDAFPLTANGKVDRAALPEPVAGPAGEAPDGPLEEYLAGIWTELLGRRPGRSDNFFEAGGHSMLATQVAARIRTALELPALPLNALFQAQTIETLAEFVTELEPAPGHAVELARLQLMLDALSPDEINQLLADDADRIEETR
jgi:amino acid adenylation domain-containing protein